MAAIEIPFVLAVDVGSPKAGRLGWADRAGHGGASEFPGAVDRLATRLRIDGRAAIGFEAPIWAPGARASEASPSLARGSSGSWGGRGPLAPEPVPSRRPSGS